MKVETYKLTAGNGKHIRLATKVTRDDGTEIKFMEKLSKKEAIEQANRQWFFQI